MNEVAPVTEYTPVDQRSDFEQWETELTDIEFTDTEIELVGREAPHRTWPETGADTIVTEEIYNGRIAWRAGNAEHLLDAARASISTESQAKTWTVLKLQAIELQDGAYYDGKWDEVNVLADIALMFASGLDVNMDEYERSKND
jgi:hypothetical protein